MTPSDPTLVQTLKNAIFACEYVNGDGTVRIARDVARQLLTVYPCSLTPDELAIIRKAVVIGSISHDGDGWFAQNAGYEYEEAEATIREALVILDKLRAALEGAPHDPE